MSSKKPLHIAALITAASLATGCIDTSGLVFNQDGTPGGPDGGVYAGQIADDGPIGYWPMESFAFNETPDESVNQYDAELGADGSADFDVAGAVGSGVQLTGGASLEVDNPNPYGFGDASYSLEAWVRLDSGDGFDLWRAGESGEPGFNTFYSNEAENFTHKRYGGPTGDKNDSHGVEVGLSQMRHLAVTYDGGTQNLTVYVDGVDINARVSTVDWSPLNSRFTLVTAPMGATVTVDEVAVYDKVLEKDRIQAHVNAAQ